MKLLKIALMCVLTFNFAYAKDNMKELSFPYSFKSGTMTEDTDAKFLAYAYNFKDMPSLSEGVESIFKSASDDATLKPMLADESSLEQAKKFLSKLGDFSSIKFKYVLLDGENLVVLLECTKEDMKNPNRFMLINKEGKWDAGKISPLYMYLAKKQAKALVLKHKTKESKKIELYTADFDFLDTMLNEQELEEQEVFFYYTELYDAFLKQDFDTFRGFLDSNSAYAFNDKIGLAKTNEAIAKALGDELKEERTYRNIANLGGVYVIFFDSHKVGDTKGSLEFVFARDISCGVEIMNYGSRLDPVLLDFISR